MYIQVASDMERELNSLRSLYHRELLALRRDYVAMKTGLEKDRLGESQLSVLLNNLQQKYGQNYCTSYKTVLSPLFTKRNDLLSQPIPLLLA